MGIQAEKVGDLLPGEGELERHAALRGVAPDSQRKLDQQRCLALLAIQLRERGGVQSLAGHLIGDGIVAIA